MSRSDRWNVPRPAAKPVLSGHSPAAAHSLVGFRESLPDEHPSVTFSTSDHDGRCFTELDRHRCQHPRGHHGPCLAHVVGETGLTYRVQWGQMWTGADPMECAEVTAERDRARDLAVALEQQLAQVQSLHVSWSLGDGEPHAVAMCAECSTVWPCPTARVFIDDDLPVDLTETEGTSA